MKQEHPHAAFFRAIADGEPIENFQIRCNSYEWREMYAGGSALFGDNKCEIRRKPRTIMIGNTEVAAGVIAVPPNGTMVWVANPTCESYAYCDHWTNCLMDVTNLRRGLVHLSEDNAVAMGRALAALTEHKDHG